MEVGQVAGNDMHADDSHPDTHLDLAAGPIASLDGSPNLAFPIVGIGASAGGLQAFEEFFRACPADSGMAFVLVSHLDPDHESQLSEILQRCTAMPVLQARDQMAVVPNRVYVIPPNREMAILNGYLQLALPEQPHGQRMPIDTFLRSLAEDQGENAIGIILSGTATDGTLGLRAILGAGGICLVQDPASARYDGMPNSAIAAGYASHVLRVADMPAMLLELARQALTRPAAAPIASRQTLSGMNQVLLQLRSGTGHDFSLYRKSTIGRRVQRRMAQHNIDDVTVYARYLKANPVELQALFREILINVTSFFRDADAFVALRQSILPPLLAGRAADDVFRVWVAGCATGEEAYSIAIVLRELMDELQVTGRGQVHLQIYATDLDADAIAVARAGSYPPNICQDLTPERLRRFFSKDDAGYKVKKDIREMVVFAVHNVIKDHPFSRLDLLSCRNLLIYLQPELQDRLIPVFHHALKPEGVLFLSPSESITKRTELFSALDHKWKFYRARHAPSAIVPRTAGDLSWASSKPGRTAEASASDKSKTSSIVAMSNRALLQAYAPASVTTDGQGNILYVHGDTGRYLRPAPGPVTTKVVDMARPGLDNALRAALASAAQGTPTLNQDVLVTTSDGLSTVNLSVRLLPGQLADPAGGKNLLLLSFQEVVESGAAAPPVNVERRAMPAPTERIAQLERELACAKESLQATIEEQQEFNEELQSSNEELQSTNEELQSANEELETSKEELQSLNEEMLTVNAELNARIEQLSSIRNDMKNLLDSVNVGTLFLDHQLVIRRYTREALKIYRLIPADIGRPLGDIKSNIEGGDLLDEIRKVLDTLIPCEREVRTTAGAWYLARIQPYRTLDHVIEGAVLTFTEVTDFKLVSESVRRSEAQLATAQEIAHLGSWDLDVATGRVRWSVEMFSLFGLPPVTTPMSLADALAIISPEDRERVAAVMHKAIATQTPYDVVYRVMRPDGTARQMHSRAVTIADSTGRVTGLVGATLDLSASHAAETTEKADLIGPLMAAIEVQESP